MRRLIVMTACIGSLGVLFAMSAWNSWGTYLDKEHCPFCQDKVLEAQVFYEDSQALGMLTYKPITPGHLLIIPKRHVERFEELSDEEIASMGQVIKKVHQAASSVYKTGPYLLHQKNGREVGQTVSHIHIHYIPLKAESESVLTLIRRLITSYFKPSLTEQEMRPDREKLKQALDVSKI